MIRTVCLVLLWVGLGAACKKKEPARPMAPLPDDGAGTGTAARPADPTPPPSELSEADFDALMNETMVFFTALGTAIEGAGSDCPGMAAAIEAIVADRSEFLERVRAFDDDPTIEDRSEAWMASRKDAVAPVFGQISGGMARCGSDPAVQAAFEKMGGM